MKKFLKILLLTVTLTGILAFSGSIANAGDDTAPPINPNEGDPYALDLPAPTDPDLTTNYFTQKFLPGIVAFFVSAIGIFAFVFLVIAGIQFMTAYGQDEGIANAKKSVQYSITGTVVALLSYTIVAILVKLPLGMDSPSDTAYNRFETIVKPTDPSVKNLPVYLENPLVGLASKVIEFLLISTGLVLFVALVVSAVLMVAAQGEDEQITQAKKTLTYTVIGLVIISLSYALIHGIIEFDFFI